MSALVVGTEKMRKNLNRIGAFILKRVYPKQHKMIEAILDKAEIGDRYINDTWYWNYTCSGAEICNVFYNAAIELGYMEKQA